MRLRLQAASAWWEWTKVAVPLLLVAAAAFWGTWQFAQPAPPARVVIATGSASGTYAEVGRRYVEHFKRADVALSVKETAGSVENYQLLLDEKSGVHAAIVQGGTAPPEAEERGLQAVASIYLEPVWLFHRLGTDMARAAADLATLADMEREIAVVRVPPSYMDELYNLRLHVGYMRGRLEDQVVRIGQDGGEGAPERREKGR